MSADPVGFINCCAEARWIAAETGIDVVVAHRVLVWDMKYMAALGIAGGDVEDHEVQGL